MLSSILYDRKWWWLKSWWKKETSSDSYLIGLHKSNSIFDGTRQRNQMKTPQRIASTNSTRIWCLITRLKSDTTTRDFSKLQFVFISCALSFTTFFKAINLSGPLILDWERVTRLLVQVHPITVKSFYGYKITMFRQQTNCIT